MQWFFLGFNIPLNFDAFICIQGTAVHNYFPFVDDNRGVHDRSRVRETRIRTLAKSKTNDVGVLGSIECLISCAKFMTVLFPEKNPRYELAFITIRCLYEFIEESHIKGVTGTTETTYVPLCLKSKCFACTEYAIHAYRKYFNGHGFYIPFNNEVGIGSIATQVTSRCADEQCQENNIEKLINTEHKIRTGQIRVSDMAAIILEATEHGNQLSEDVIGIIIEYIFFTHFPSASHLPPLSSSSSLLPSTPGGPE